jgi:hypothetical protein
MNDTATKSATSQICKPLRASLRENCPMVKQLKTKKMKKKNVLMTAIAILGFASTMLAQTVPSYVPTTGLVGWWPFNGNANDESGNGNNGTPQNGASLTSDRYGFNNSAYNFDFISNNLIRVPHQSSLNLMSDFSISIWFKSNNAPTSANNYVFVSKHDNFLTCCGNNIPYIGFITWNASGHYQKPSLAYAQSGNFTFPESDTLITTNVWQHIVFVNRNDTVKMYLDGGLIYNQYFSSALRASNTEDLLFGSTNRGPALECMNGKLDDIGIWNRVLTQQEITNLFNGCQLSVSTQPINQSVNISNNAQFTTASSDPLSTYQWQTDLGVGFQNLNSVGQYSGTANDTLTIANTTLSNNNQPFRCIISSGSCTDTSNIAVLTVINNVGINEFTQDNLFSVYPNPANSQINVKLDSKLLGSVYTIYDNIGKVALSGKIISENTTIELGNLAGGIYLFSVGENLKQTFKVIKE